MSCYRIPLLCVGRKELVRLRAALAAAPLHTYRVCTVVSSRRVTVAPAVHVLPSQLVLPQLPCAAFVSSECRCSTARRRRRTCPPANARALMTVDAFMRRGGWTLCWLCTTTAGSVRPGVGSLAVARTIIDGPATTVQKRRFGYADRCWVCMPLPAGGGLGGGARGVAGAEEEEKQRGRARASSSRTGGESDLRRKRYFIKRKKARKKYFSLRS